MEQVSERLVDQRIRNRVIECLEHLVEGDEGIRALGDVEYFFDWIDDDRPWDWRDNSAYTPDEVAALERVLAAMLGAVQETREMDAEQTVGSGWPRRIAPIAHVALELMATRERFGEQSEELTPTP